MMGMETSKEWHQNYYQKNKERLKEYARNYYRENRDEIRSKRFSQTWQYRLEVKKKAVDKLGGRCVDCGIDELDVLEIDHIVPCGSRREGSGTMFYRQIMNGKVQLENLQILCGNCHNRKTAKERRK